MRLLRRVAFLLVAVALFLALAPAAVFAQQSAPPPPPKKKASKVWTNEDLQQLRSARGFSVVGTPSAAPPASQKAAAAEPAEQPSGADAEKEMLDELKALTPEQRQALLTDLERDVAEIPEVLDDLREKLFAESDEARRAQLQQEIERLEGLLPQRERELELLRQVMAASPQAPAR